MNFKCFQVPVQILQTNVTLTLADCRQVICIHVPFKILRNEKLTKLGYWAFQHLNIPLQPTARTLLTILRWHCQVFPPRTLEDPKVRRCLRRRNRVLMRSKSTLSTRSILKKREAQKVVRTNQSHLVMLRRQQFDHQGWSGRKGRFHASVSLALH